MSKTYSSPAGFKTALEQRLRTAAKGGTAFARKRQLLVFDRFLARVVAVLGDAATLKGGLVLVGHIASSLGTRGASRKLAVLVDGSDLRTLSLRGRRRAHSS